jgi:hypothetical protein
VEDVDYIKQVGDDAPQYIKELADLATYGAYEKLREIHRHKILDILKNNREAIYRLDNKYIGIVGVVLKQILRDFPQ